MLLYFRNRENVNSSKYLGFIGTFNLWTQYLEAVLLGLGMVHTDISKNVIYPYLHYHFPFIPQGILQIIVL